jgi:hypothetical protein
MALPSSGAISLSQIAAEFGGSAPHNITEYYRGGTYVPNAAPNLSVPTSGAIKLTDFYGAAAVAAVDLFGDEIFASGSTLASCIPRYGLTNLGAETTKSGTGGLVTINTWLNSGSASLYDARVTMVTTTGVGSDSGNFDLWYSLGTSREWNITTAGTGTYYEVICDVEIRLNSSGVVLATATLTLTSDRF